jgi:hypothetical protein
MIKRQCVITYEKWVDGHAERWGTQTFTTKSWCAPDASKLVTDSQVLATEMSGGEPNQIRITGVFKL